MDFKLSDEQITRRDLHYSVCKELDKRKPLSFRQHAFEIEAKYSSDEGWQYHLMCAKEFARRGWLSHHWPREYGGEGGSMMDQVLFEEARGYYGIPGEDAFGVGMLAPTLIACANEEIKKKFLPPIAAAEVSWCEGWSEPNAGSDLAAVTTSAIRKGDDYVVNGQKIWTTGAHRADWIFMLVRTNPNIDRPQQGLSFILADMKTPGITVNPILYMDMTHTYNEVFFDDVHVPARNIVGEENKGWAVTQTLAGFERSNIEFVTMMYRQLEDAVEYLNEVRLDGEPMAKKPLIRDKIADLACNLEAARALSYRVADLQDKGQFANFDASAIKIFASDLQSRFAFTMTEILGPYGQVKASKWAPLYGVWEEWYQQHFALSVSMGTNEIQKNIIAWAGLGLPRMR